MENIDTVVTVVMSIVVIVVALVALGFVLKWLYQRATKEISYVRTGFGGQRILMNGGAIVLPVLHETIPVNMNTLKLEVRRANDQALITKDCMRVDVLAEFCVRVQPTQESIANAAQTLGIRTMGPSALKELVEGNFVDALRAVVAEMAMEDLHEKRVSFVQKVQAAVSENLLMNGLELESVSLTGLDQSNRDFFNPDNAFDAEGLTKLTQEIEERRKKRNDIEQETEVLVRRKNLEAEQQKQEIERDTEYAKLAQEREVAVRKAAQMAEVAGEEVERMNQAETAKIVADQSVKQAEITSNQTVEQQRIQMDQETREREIVKSRTVDTAEVDKLKSVELAEQDRAIADKSREQSHAQAEADAARALAVRAEEEVATVREVQMAERQKQVQLGAGEPRGRTPGDRHHGGDRGGQHGGRRLGGGGAAGSPGRGRSHPNRCRGRRAGDAAAGRGRRGQLRRVGGRPVGAERGGQPVEPGTDRASPAPGADRGPAAHHRGKRQADGADRRDQDPAGRGSRRW